jgi:hypothetical protein
MAYDRPLPGSLMVGEPGNAKNFDSIRYAVVSVPATSVSVTAALVTVSVAGVDAVRDQAILMNSPADNASCIAVGCRVSGANAIVVKFANCATGGTTPAGNYTFMVLRASIGN